MIIVKLMGGMGNQMFQYAFASILAKKNNVPLLIDKSLFDLIEKKTGYTPRKFELHVFNNSYIPASPSVIASFNQLTVINKIKRKVGLYSPRIYEEVTSNFHSEALSVIAPIYLKGYFQSYKYLSGFENHIKNIFSFQLDKMDEYNKELLYLLKNRNTISIHIRRGDYADDTIIQQFHGSCNLEYYLSAISLIGSKFSDFLFVFFSDDSKWVKEKFGNLHYPKIFIDQNKNEDSWKDMFLMNSCNHHIIANSTFSWWGAWLNPSPNKIVIAPKQWFVDPIMNSNTIDLIPSNWIRL